MVVNVNTKANWWGESLIFGEFEDGARCGVGTRMEGRHEELAVSFGDW
jgi:hypothetical protein